MLWYETIKPDSISGVDLDDFLQKGWYRIGQTIMTTNWSILEETLFSVFWLRYPLAQYRPGQTAKKLLNQGKHFSVSIQQQVINEELEQLYQRYRAKLSFDTARTLSDNLMGDATSNIFHTQVVELRLGNQLVAAGFFDRGLTAMAGILNIYDPDYHQYSLGKLLMLHKINYARQLNMSFFYPGYISYCVPNFDYKLFADKKSAELFIRSTNSWLPFHSIKLSDEYNRLLKTDLFGESPANR